jgi:hypothetical protein
VGNLDTQAAMSKSVRAALASTRAKAALFSTDAFRESVIKPAIQEARLDGLFQTLRESPGDDQLTEEINALFGEIPGSGLLLHEAAQELTLLLPFGYDLAVRRALQVIVMLAVAAAIIGISLYAGPLPAAILAAAGTPKPRETWKAVGNAYDRIYGAGQYHPDKAIETKNSPDGPQERGRSSW